MDKKINHYKLNYRCSEFEYEILRVVMTSDFKIYVNEILYKDELTRDEFSLENTFLNSIMGFKIVNPD